MDARIDALARTPGAVAHLVAEATEEQLDAARADGWNARTIMAHLRDDEFLCLRPALERALALDEPQVHFLEGRDWEPGRNRTRERREWLLADFALQRKASVAILHALRPEDWQRTMTSPGRGLFTISQLVDAWLRHDQEHLRQLERSVGESLEEVLERRSQMVDWRTGRRARQL